MGKKNLVEEFITQIIANSAFTELDRIYLRNRILALVGDEALKVETTSDNLLDLKDELIVAAQNNGLIANSNSAYDILGAQLLNFIVPRPSIVNQKFWESYQLSPQKAIADFYQMSKASDYIKTRAIARNIYFTAGSKYGDLEITINLSKPEKDPKDIAAARYKKTVSYPQCQLCMENEGYLGHSNYPARTNHRVIRFKLGNETWGFQYSPYAYFNEHCIFLAPVHEKTEDK